MGNSQNVMLESLTPEQKKALLAELRKEEQQKAEATKNERATYKELVNNAVDSMFPVLKNASFQLREAKTKVFDEFQSLIKMKQELYEREESQQSHTFTSTDGKLSITVGYNITDGWDDTVNVGVEKVKEYLASLVTDERSKDLVGLIMKLLVKDGKGNLKANRVLQLKQLADKSGNKEFIDAISIIQDSYKPVRSKEYIRCTIKTDTGEFKNLALSITDADFLEKE